MSIPTHVCGYVIKFTDGGENEAEVLHVGTKEECERVADLIPAVAYSGNRPVKDCWMRVAKLPDPEGDDR